MMNVQKRAGSSKLALVPSARRRCVATPRCELPSVVVVWWKEIVFILETNGSKRISLHLFVIGKSTVHILCLYGDTVHLTSCAGSGFRSRFKTKQDVQGRSSRLSDPRQALSGSDCRLTFRL